MPTLRMSVPLKSGSGRGEMHTESFLAARGLAEAVVKSREVQAAPSAERVNFMVMEKIGNCHGQLLICTEDEKKERAVRVYGRRMKLNQTEMGTPGILYTHPSEGTMPGIHPSERGSRLKSQVT